MKRVLAGSEVFMQTTGYVTIGDEKILVLCRQKRFSRQFKVRKSGKDGNQFTDESIALVNEPELLAKLKKGQAIEL